MVSFLEERLSSEEATQHEEELYLEYKWTGKMNTQCKEFKMVIHMMNKLYGGEI